MATTQSWLPQFSLRAVLIAIAILGIGLAAVLSASENWALALAAAFHLLIPTAIVLAIMLTGQTRAFWMGVVVFGLWCVLFFADKAEFIADRVASDVQTRLHEDLSVAVVELHTARIEREANRLTSEEAHLFSRGRSPDALASIMAARRPSLVDNARSRLQSLVTTSARRFLMILLALGGGCLASWAFRCRESAAAATASAAEPPT